MMYAVVELGGKQYRVTEGDMLEIEKINSDVDETFDVECVMACSDGKALKVGKPYLEDSKVTAKVVEHGKGKKVIIFKYKAKKDYRKKQGHRQPYTLIKIEKIQY